MGDSFEVVKTVFDMWKDGGDVMDGSKPAAERASSGLLAGSGAASLLSSAIPALEGAGPLLFAGGAGLYAGSKLDEHLGLSDKISDATNGVDGHIEDAGALPVHFRGAAGAAEASLLATGRQQSFLEDETARQVQIAQLIQNDDPMSRHLLRAQGVDMPEHEDSPFGQWAH